MNAKKIVLGVITLVVLLGNPFAKIWGQAQDQGYIYVELWEWNHKEGDWDRWPGVQVYLQPDLCSSTKVSSDRGMVKLYLRCEQDTLHIQSNIDSSHCLVSPQQVLEVPRGWFLDKGQWRRLRFLNGQAINKDCSDRSALKAKEWILLEGENTISTIEGNRLHRSRLLQDSLFKALELDPENENLRLAYRLQKEIVEEDRFALTHQSERIAVYGPEAVQIALQGNSAAEPMKVSNRHVRNGDLYAASLEMEQAILGQGFRSRSKREQTEIMENGLVLSQLLGQDSLTERYILKALALGIGIASFVKAAQILVKNRKKQREKAKKEARREEKSQSSSSGGTRGSQGQGQLRAKGSRILNFQNLPPVQLLVNTKNLAFPPLRLGTNASSSPLSVGPIQTIFDTVAGNALQTRVIDLPEAGLGFQHEGGFTNIFTGLQRTTLQGVNSIGETFLAKYTSLESGLTLNLEVADISPAKSPIAMKMYMEVGVQGSFPFKLASLRDSLANGNVVPLRDLNPTTFKISWAPNVMLEFKYWKLFLKTPWNFPVNLQPTAFNRLPNLSFETTFSISLGSQTKSSAPEP